MLRRMRWGGDRGPGEGLEWEVRVKVFVSKRARLVGRRSKSGCWLKFVGDFAQILSFRQNAQLATQSSKVLKLRTLGSLPLQTKLEFAREYTLHSLLIPLSLSRSPIHQRHIHIHQLPLSINQTALQCLSETISSTSAFPFQSSTSLPPQPHPSTHDTPQQDTRCTADRCLRPGSGTPDRSRRTSSPSA